MGLGIKHRIKEKYAAYTFAYKKYREGLPWVNISIADIVKFYKYSIQHKNQKRYKTNLLGKTISTFNNYFWFYHSVEEIFVDEVYKCNFNSAEPYIIDCGANIGLSVIYFKQKYPNAKIIAFEPDKFQFDNLLQNIE